MASVTLVESAKLAQDQLVSGVIETIVTVDQMFQILPFQGIDGNSLAYNRELLEGGAGVIGVGGLISSGATDVLLGGNTAKNAATFTQVNSNLTTIIADAEVNNLVQSTRSGDGNDQKAVQIASKAKKVARSYQHMLINGSGASNQFSGLLNLCPAGQTISGAVNGTQFSSLKLLDDLMAKVKDKDGRVDYFAMNIREINAYYDLLRTLGGASIGEVVTLPSGEQVPGYRGVPIFRNDFIPITQTQGTATNATTIFCGTIDDGSMSTGIAGITASKASGINVREVGQAEDKDESITRLTWYCGLALFSELGIACADGISPTGAVYV